MQQTRPQATAGWLAGTARYALEYGLLHKIRSWGRDLGKDSAERWTVIPFSHIYQYPEAIRDMLWAIVERLSQHRNK